MWSTIHTVFNINYLSDRFCGALIWWMCAKYLDVTYLMTLRSNQSLACLLVFFPAHSMHTHTQRCAVLLCHLPFRSVCLSCNCNISFDRLLLLLSWSLHLLNHENNLNRAFYQPYWNSAWLIGSVLLFVRGSRAIVFSAWPPPAPFSVCIIIVPLPASTSAHSAGTM